MRDMDYKKYSKSMFVIKCLWVVSFVYFCLLVFHDFISGIGLWFLFPGGFRISLFLSIMLFVGSWLAGIALTYMVRKKCPHCGEPLQSQTAMSRVSVIYHCPRCQFRHETRTNFDTDNIE